MQIQLTQPSQQKVHIPALEHPYADICQFIDRFYISTHRISLFLETFCCRFEQWIMGLVVILLHLLHLLYNQHWEGLLVRGYTLLDSPLNM